MSLVSVRRGSNAGYAPMVFDLEWQFMTGWYVVMNCRTSIE